MTKRTRYFENYQDAYNYYGGTEVPSSEIALIGNASYVFVSSDNSYGGGNTQYFDAGMTNDTIVVTLTENAYTSGSSYGYEQGYAYGYQLGYTEGTTYGESIGYVAGQAYGEEIGYAQGYEGGYSYGYSEGVASVPVPTGNVDITTTSQYNVTTYATAQVVDANLSSGNIADGVTILGVTGSYLGGITPTGTAYLQLNTLTDVSAYEFAYCADTNGSYTAGYEGGTSYGYDWGYDEGYADGEDAAGDAQWEPIEHVVGSLEYLDTFGGTEDHLDLYWGGIHDNFSREEILDERDNTTVIGYKFEWDEPSMMVVNRAALVEKKIHVVHEAMLDNGLWPQAEISGQVPEYWFSFACEAGSNGPGPFISDFYDEVTPVLRNVTLRQALPGADYDYELNFDSLVYENYYGDMFSPPNTISVNGLHLTGSSSASIVDVESSGGSLDPNDDIVKDASKWEVHDYGYRHFDPSPLFKPWFYGQPIGSMSIMRATEAIDSCGDENIVIVDKFNPRGTVDVINETQDVTITYQRNDPEDPNPNAYISIDIDPIDAGESVGLSFADFSEEYGENLLRGIYWGTEDNVHSNHWIITAEQTGTYTIRLDDDGNGGCTMTITAPR